MQKRISRVLLIALLAALLCPALAFAQNNQAEDDLDSGGYAGGTGWADNWTESGDDGSASTGLITNNGSALQLTGASQTFIASDDFESDGYSGGSGAWLGNWIDSQDGDPGDPEIQVDDVAPTGDLEAEFTQGADGQSLSREVNLGSDTSMQLTFTLGCSGNEDSSGATDQLDVIVDGGVKQSISGCPAGGGGGETTFTIDVSSVSTTPVVEFELVSMTAGDEFYTVDDVEITTTDQTGTAFIHRGIDLSDLPVNAGLLLFFDISFNDSLETTDILEVFASDDGGSSWTEVRQFNGEAPFEGESSRTMTLDISEFRGSDTRLRFGISSGLTDGNEAFTIDNPEVFSIPIQADFAADEFVGGNALSTASSSNSTDEAQVFDNDEQPYIDDGLTIIRTGPNSGNGPVMLFDTSDPTGGDTDIAAPNGDTNSNGNSCLDNDGINSGPGSGADRDGDGFNDAALGSGGENCRPLGNSIIMSEEWITTEPDDDTAGGTFRFDFDAPLIDFGGFKLVDDLEGDVTLFFSDGTSETQAFPDGLVDEVAQGENGKFFVSFKDFTRHTDIVAIEVTLDGSGDVNNLMFSSPGVDYGDALDSYGTDETNSGGEGVGASHRIDPTHVLRIGDDVDSEGDGQPGGAADGDDQSIPSSTTERFDDEDGVTMPNSSSNDGIYTVTVDVTNETGETANLVGWVDFDQDGVFQSDEGVAVSVPASGGNADCTDNGSNNFTCELQFTVPEDDRNNTGEFVGRFRLTTDSLTTSQPTGLVNDGEVEDHVASINSLPVSLNSFESRLFGNRLDVEWTTTSETFNVGFHVWGKLEGEWSRLTDRPVLSKSTDAVTPESYRTRIRVRDFDPRSIEGLALSSIETTGSQELYGSFEVGESYGEKALPEPIPWRDIREAYNARMSGKGYFRHGRKWYRSASDGQASEDRPVLELSVSEAGMQRVTYSDLRAAGLDLRGVRPEAIAVTLKGEGVPRHIDSRGRAGFGPGDHIDFWGRQPDFPDALYLSNYIYRVEVDPSQARPAGRVSRRADSGQSQALFPVRVNEDNAYSFVNATADPWHARMLMHPWGPKSYLVSMGLDGALVADAPGRVEAVLTGFSDFPEVDPDHRIQLIVNGQVVLEEDVSGHRAVTLSAEVPAGVLTEGENTVAVSLPGGTAAPYDIVTVDRLALWYPRSLTTSTNALHVEGAVTEGGLAAGGFTSRQVEAYATDDGGNLARLNVTRRLDPAWQASLADAVQRFWSLRFQLIFARGDREERRRLVELIREVRAEFRELLRNRTWQVTVPAVADTPGVEGVEYWLSAPSMVNQPQVLGSVQVDEDPLLDQPADYLVIVHPSFLPGEGDSSHPLSRYVERRESQGWRVRLVGLDVIQDVYGGGMALPQAVTGFLKAADEAFDYSHVLLVGDDTYDYQDKLGLGSVSFVPTMYADTNQIHHSPSDGLMTDLDGDGISDKAVGRWPVRTLTDLEVMVQKTLDWEDPVTGPRGERTSVWVTDSADPNVSSFESQAERMIDTLRTPQAGGHGEPWPEANISRVYFDQVEASAGQSVAATARDELMEALAAGQTITGFAGHGSPTDWTFQGLLSSRHVNEMENEGRPTLITTLTCYTSYFVSPNTDTLAHRLMAGYRVDSNGDPVPGVANGAVAVHGAATLSGYGDNEKLARTALEHQLSDGDTLGEAILKARQAAAAAGQTDTAKNWALLGDPTLTVEP